MATFTNATPIKISEGVSNSTSATNNLHTVAAQNCFQGQVSILFVSGSGTISITVGGVTILQASQTGFFNLGGVSCGPGDSVAAVFSPGVSGTATVSGTGFVNAV